jgi:hypothetical protein
MDHDQRTGGFTDPPVESRIPLTARPESPEERRLYSQDYHLKRKPAKEPALARKIQQSDQQKANAQEFRRRAIDAALKRALRLLAVKE